jgi:hypothetical protein
MKLSLNALTKPPMETTEYQQFAHKLELTVKNKFSPSSPKTSKAITQCPGFHQAICLSKLYTFTANSTKKPSCKHTFVATLGSLNEMA